MARFGLRPLRKMIHMAKIKTDRLKKKKKAKRLLANGSMLYSTIRKPKLEMADDP